ncbi:MAG: 50S ribosomal protein L23 [Kiritimatiellae bacterium]|nr:50S ribosomal protein L23 [Kiritimatiellia bacterium]
MTNEEIIKRVLITEKGSAMSADNRYMLEVSVKATKPQIADAVEKKFGVHVLAVRTANMKGARKFVRGTRRVYTEATWKKAIVTVKAGERIEQV